MKLKMKQRRTVITIILTLAVFLSGCENNAQTKKEALKLNNFAKTNVLEIEPADIITGEVNLDAANIPEIPEKKYNNMDELKPITEFVNNQFLIELDEKWSITVHYFDDAETAGMVRLRYDIGKIKTNKAITFSIESGVISSFFCSCLNDNTDEQAIMERVEKFTEKYEQEQYKLRQGEKLSKETIDFTYYYHTNMLMYTYNVFFIYGDGMINNDYGTEVLIDENGDVL